MKITFRTDASLQIGTGHITRCLTLAKALRGQGVECTFVCREHPGHWIDQIRHNGFKCSPLPLSKHKDESSDSNGSPLEHTAWLGANWQTDARETLHALGQERVDWLVVDHYAINNSWEEILSPHVAKVMVIDDLADRVHKCNLLLDQNLVSNFETRYQGLVPTQCSTLLGPEYAVLQPEYAELHPRTPPRFSPIKRILVSFGGADQKNHTGRAVSAFLKLKRADISLDVVVNPNSRHMAEIEAQAKSFCNVTVYGALNTLAPLMLQADLAIGASGVTSWERCCLGLPSLVITLAENQKPIAAELQKQGLIHWLGHHDEVTETMILSALIAVIDDKRLENWSRACKSIVDGRGLKRVVSILSLKAETKLVARYASLDDEKMLLGWANDPLVRANSFSPETISAEIHRNWFYLRLRDPEHCVIYIVETEEGLPLGQVRFERVENEWEIHYSLASFARGRGLAHSLLRTALTTFRVNWNGAVVFGRVKQGNLPSQKIFDGLGFVESELEGQIVYWRFIV